MLEITAFAARARLRRALPVATTGRPSPCEANARRTGREAEFVAALDRFCDEWNRGDADRARFEKEYLLAVGRRR